MTSILYQVILIAIVLITVVAIGWLLMVLTNDRDYIQNDEEI